MSKTWLLSSVSHGGRDMLMMGHRPGQRDHVSGGGEGRADRGSCRKPPTDFGSGKEGISGARTHVAQSRRAVWRDERPADAGDERIGGRIGSLRLRLGRRQHHGQAPTGGHHPADSSRRPHQAPQMIHSRCSAAAMEGRTGSLCSASSQVLNSATGSVRCTAMSSASCRVSARRS